MVRAADEEVATAAAEVATVETGWGEAETAVEEEAETGAAVARAEMGADMEWVEAVTAKTTAVGTVEVWVTAGEATGVVKAWGMAAVAAVAVTVEAPVAAAARVAGEEGMDAEAESAEEDWAASLAVH